MHHVRVLLFDGVQSLDVSGPVEVFANAGAYRVTTASPGGRPVRTSSGLTLIPDGPLDDGPLDGGPLDGGPPNDGPLNGGPLGAGPPDTLVVPGGAGTRLPPPEVVEWLRRNGDRPKRVMSVCTGAFLLAEAGLLDGRRATTHWHYCATLAKRYPEVTVEPDPIFVRDGGVFTSAGVTAGIDLALALVEEDLGRDAALMVARALVMFLRRPGNQAQFSAQLSAQTAHREPLRDVQRLIIEHPEADLSVTALAAHANLSPRQFARAFAAETGISPGRYVDRVRLETARRLLEETTDGVAEVAKAAGYGTPEAMRRAFLGAIEVSPAEYRRRFSRNS
ncbi:GlxA family transcriptional regulator [Paractinoplanes deccanensis]|uniref:GlxA family transcriptional regulator n=1 Tax=Paractinoplanes deccanensis TaxID=113561 RepID=UPI001940403D|nr:GlxA family transcriptional regulator [Actinoplanes deccanensis]